MKNSLKIRDVKQAIKFSPIICIFIHSFCVESSECALLLGVKYSFLLKTVLKMLFKNAIMQTLST